MYEVIMLQADRSINNMKIKRLRGAHSVANVQKNKCVPTMG